MSIDNWTQCSNRKIFPSSALGKYSQFFVGVLVAEGRNLDNECRDNCVVASNNENLVQFILITST